MDIETCHGFSTNPNVWLSNVCQGPIQRHLKSSVTEMLGCKPIHLNLCWSDWVAETLAHMADRTSPSFTNALLMTVFIIGLTKHVACTPNFGRIVSLTYFAGHIPYLTSAAEVDVTQHIHRLPQGEQLSHWWIALNRKWSCSSNKWPRTSTCSLKDMMGLRLECTRSIRWHMCNDDNKVAGSSPLLSGGMASPLLWWNCVQWHVKLNIR